MQFGTPPPVEAIERAGAYAVIVDVRWRVALVEVGGALHLPGGGIEPGESAEEALRREVAEEAGLGIEILGAIGTARQFVAWNGRWWNKVGQFFLCRPLTEGPPGEPGHVRRWSSVAEARRSLAHAYYKWAVDRAFAAC